VERTSEHYRVRTELEPGAIAVLDVVEERPVVRRHELLDMGDDQLRLLFQSRELPEDVRQAMAEISAQRAAIGERRRTLQRLEDQIDTVLEDQARLRQNLQAVPQQSDIHRRYLANLGELEDRLAGLRQQSEAARTVLEEAEEAHRDYVRGLNM
jgi:septal ring factor EnvC (AmiA/AmiB activator)